MRKNTMSAENNSEILIYQIEDGQTKIDVRVGNETVWLTQAEMAELFQKERTAITKHINNIFKEAELNEECKFGVFQINLTLFLNTNF